MKSNQWYIRRNLTKDGGESVNDEFMGRGGRGGF